MLPRVLEPEVMDTPEEAIGYDAMDHSAVNRRFVEDFLSFHGPCRGRLIVDLGTGTARIPIELCLRDPAARVLGVDLSAEMLAVGRTNVARHQLEGRVELELLDAKRSSLPDEGFEAVVSNSIVHHIPEPAGVFAEMVRLAAPGGTWFVRDLLRPSNLEELEGLVQLHAGAEPEHARAMFRASLHAALTLDEVRSIVAALGRDPANVQPTSDRHWTWCSRRA